MKRRRQTIIFVMLTFFIMTGVISGQDDTPDRDKYTLLTIPYNNRQLTMYRGELQVLAGYKFSVRTRLFGPEGNMVTLRTQGAGSVYHYYFVDLKYGLTDFIEISAETNLLRKGIREETQVYRPVSVANADVVTVNKLSEYKGLGDLLFKLTFRLPVKYRWFDLSATGGLFVPSSKYEPQQPDHTVTNITAANNYTVNYQYRFKNGYGIPVYLVASAMKISAGKIAGEVAYSFRTPVKEGSNIRWDETLVDKTFSYSNESYLYLLNNSHSLDASLHYQATGWFDIFLNASYMKTAGGWTEYYGKKYRNPETSLVAVEPGFELQISPSLKVYQVAGFPVRGKSSDAPFYLFTTISFSNFPFFR